MSSANNTTLDQVLDWCAEVIGPIKTQSDRTRQYSGDKKTSIRFETPSGACYLKIHRDQSRWEQEVHGYQHWAPVFGDQAPKLLAVREQEPLALVVTALPGTVLEETTLPPQQERSAWRAAGSALVALHALSPGPFFGPVRRNGTSAEQPITDAVEYITRGLQTNLDRGRSADYLAPAEQATVRNALSLAPAFAGQPPVPCHRDYSPANWLVDQTGAWSGVIDFEFAHWDVPAADYSRYPDWDWIKRPDLVDAFFAGYSPLATVEAKQQRLVSLVAYGLGAIVWGNANEYFGFAREGHEALACLASELG